MKKRSKADIFYGLSFLVSFAVVIYSLLVEEIHYIVTYASILLTGVFITMVYNRYFRNATQQKLSFLENRLKLWNTISYRVKIAGETSFNDMPIGIIVYNEGYAVEWANKFAKEIFLSNLVERNLQNINSELVEKLKSKSEFDIVLYGKEYQCSLLREDNILFLTDKTDYRELETKYRERTLAAGIINLDNLDQALIVVDPQERSMILSNLIGIISEWCNKNNIYVRGYSEDQYIILMDRQTLNKVLETQFDILDEIKEFCEKKDLRITASIGICCEDKSVSEIMELAKNQLSFALNRGGNQAIVSVDGTNFYFGGKTGSIENRSPVYVRVKAQDLKALMENSNRVYVIAHNDTDTDGFGAILSTLHFAKSVGKECKAIFTREYGDETIKALYDKIAIEHINILANFISPSDAYHEFTDNDLLIIVDTQNAEHIAEPKLVKKAKRLAIIDHHRRGANAIKDYSYIYNQTSSSSTVEIINEMYEYLDGEIFMSPFEATIMLLGIIVDTNNLMFRTSYRTFNVMSNLQSYGAEMATVKKFLREDFGEYVEKMSILNSMELHNNTYAIAKCNPEKQYTRQFIAKVTDSMISVSGVKAAFCIGRLIDGKVGISARSLDEENVQVIMERLKGGGHFNNAATQLTDVTIEDARDMLVHELDRVKSGGEDKMKIILTKDVKGKGKDGDIIDIPSGHANYLIRSKSAVLATIDNMKELEKQKNESKVEAEKHLAKMQEVGKFVENNPITVSVKVGKEGKLFGSISTKQIVDEYKAKYDVTLDKRKVEIAKTIDSLGTYTVNVELHKEVKVKLTLYVVEKV